jgi:hypothetical protein
MKKTKEIKNREAQQRAALKRNAQDQLDHLDKENLTATKERARLNNLLDRKQ